jgi:hypothetical protein
VALCAVDLSCRGRSGGAFLVPVLPAGKFVQEKGDGTRADFLIPAAVSQYDRPINFPIIREDSQFKHYLQGFRYTNDMEKLAEGRIVASDVESCYPEI